MFSSLRQFWVFTAPPPLEGGGDVPEGGMYRAFLDTTGCPIQGWG